MARVWKAIRLLWLYSVGAGLFTIRVWATDVFLQWDPPDGTNVVSYRVYFGTSTNRFDGWVSVDASTNVAQITNLVAGQTYYFTATAADAEGIESDYSNLVEYVIPGGAPGNTPPNTMDLDVAAIEDRAGSLALTATDAENDPLTYSISQAPARGALSGTPPNVTYTPRANYFGTDQFTYAVSDGQSSATGLVRITVAAVNDAPTLNGLTNLTLTSDGSTQAVSLVGISTGATNESESLTITATSSNPDTLPNPIVNYTSPDSTGTLLLRAVSNQSGVATITVTVNDGAASNNTVVRSFTVTVIRPLVISNLRETWNDARTVALAWNTDRPANCVLHYWTAVWSNSVAAQANGTNYSATLTNLTPNMTYHLRAQASTSNAVAAVDGTTATEPATLLRLHAEDGVLAPPMRQLTSAQTENGKYVESGIGGTATYMINATRGLNYRIWARVKVPAGGASFSASVDGAPQRTVFAGDFRATNSWHWVLLTDPAQILNALMFPLEAGTHQIVFGSSAKNISLDEFAISNDPVWQPILPTTVPMLSVVRTGEMTADLQWFDPSQDAVSVSIESSVDGRLFTPNQTVAANTSSARVSNLLPGVAYFFRVYSYNSLDRTDYSNTAAAH